MKFDFSNLNIELPENWSIVRVGDIARVNSETIKKGNEPEFIHYIDISSVSTGQMESPKKIDFKEAPSRARRVLSTGDIIISCVRPNLKQYILLEEVGSNWVASTGFCVVTCKESYYRWFLYAFLTSELFTEYLVRVADGAAYPAFSPSEIEDALIPWPSDNEVKKINAFIKSVNNKISLNRKTNETLEQIAQALFKSWFVDFDPVKAKSEGRQPVGMDEATAALFPDSFEESELGMIPKGWKICDLKSVTSEIKRGISPKYIENGGVQVLNQRCIRNHTIDFLFARRHNQLENNNLRGAVEIGDVLVNSTGTGTLGRIAPVRFLSEQTLHDSHITVVRADHSQISKSYIIGLMILNEKLIEYSGTGSTGQTELRREVIENILICNPDNKVLNEFEKKSWPIHLKIANSEIENIQLATIRDTLLPKLLSGEITIGEAGEQVGELS